MPTETLISKAPIYSKLDVNVLSDISCFVGPTVTIQQNCTWMKIITSNQETER